MKFNNRTVDTAKAQGLDETDGKWVVICEAHNTIVNVRTKEIAIDTMTPDFCDGCRKFGELPKNFELYWQSEIGSDWVLETHFNSMQEALGYLVHSVVLVGKYKVLDTEGKIVMSLTIKGLEQ